MTITVLVLEHDPTDPPLLVGQWLREQGAELDLRRLHLGDELPASAEHLVAIISMGGEMGAGDDDVAPWLPATRALLADAVARGVPTFGICLGAQLLAAATGGTVQVGSDGPEIGAYLTAKRDAADEDPVFMATPLTPDVMHYHYDVISSLPPAAVLLMSSPGYPHQAFRVGPRAWGTQFHFETTAADVRQWAQDGGIPSDRPRLGAMLDEAEETMAIVWRDVIHRFLALAQQHAAGTDTGLLGRRLPLAGS